MAEPSEIGLRPGSTTVVCVDGEWYWWGDWTHHRLETIEHNALKLREFCEEFGRHLKECVGAHKDADDDYFYLYTLDLKEVNKLPTAPGKNWLTTLDIDHPWVKEGWIIVSHREAPQDILEGPPAFRDPNYGSGYFRWDERPPVKPETLPVEYTTFDSQEEKNWPYPLPEDPYLIMPPSPPPPPPPPSNEFEGRIIFDNEDAKKTQSKLF